MPTPAAGGARHNSEKGFSLLELMISVVIILVMVAIAIPTIDRSYQIYQLNRTASQVADVMKLTRFAAIRRNTTVNCTVAQIGGVWNVWTNASSTTPTATPGAQDRQVVLPGAYTVLAAAAAPSPSTMGFPTAPTAVSPSSTTNFSFDAHGGVSVAGATAVYVLYLGNSGGARYGFRAVTLRPSGVTQLWSAPQGGPWRQFQ